MTIGERSGVRTSTWLHADDCSVDDLRAIVEVTTDGRDYPHAADVVDNVLVYDCDRLRAEIATPAGRRSSPGRARRGDGRRSRARRARRRLPRPVDRRSGDRCVRGDHRRPARGRTGRRRPLRQAGRQRPGLERAREARAARPRRVRRLLRQRDHRARVVGVARPELPDHIAGQRRQPGWRRPGSPSRLPPRVPVRRDRARRSRPTLTGCRRCSRCRARSPTTTCRSRAVRRCTCRTRRSTSSATSPGADPTSPSTSPSTTSSSRSPRATPCSSTRRSSTPPATTASSDIKRMANLLQVSSAFGRAMETVDREAISNALFPALLAPGSRRRRRRPAAQCDRGVGRGLLVPHQPRPRSTDRRIGPRDPGRARVARRDRRTGSPSSSRAELRAQAERHLTDSATDSQRVRARSVHSAGGIVDLKAARLSSTSVGELMPTITAVTPSTVSG